ncbi:unnamed protein product [Dovyalis caffra]|uniref:RING-type E3 ubiquitin transferase n=1 Tax=Dovyalis caffra TaxID=77055 RepID=A0AAV1SP98_9ROSI|nr:unnamed protein product [Dovyalis caffra]
MWMPRSLPEKRDVGNGLIAVAIDKDKGSQIALKWAIDNLLVKGQTVILIHVSLKSSFSSHSASQRMNQIADSNGASNVDPKELFLPFRCFCTRKDISCKDVILEDTEVAKALIGYVNQNAIETLIVGASAKGGFLRFKAADVASSVSKGAPDFCTVYVISKGKIQSIRAASRSAPINSSLHNQFHNQNSTSPASMDAQIPPLLLKEYPNEKGETLSVSRRTNVKIFATENRSPFTRKGLNGKSYGELSVPDTDISFVSSGRPSIDRIFPSFYDNTETSRTPPRLSNISDIDSNYSFESSHYGRRSMDQSGFSPELSNFSNESDQMLSASDDVEAEMRRLKLELKQTMEMYSSACKEALTAKQKARELQRWKMEEEQRLEEARLAEEAALAIAEKEKAKSKAAIEAAEAAQRIAELEAQKRISAEMKARKEAEEKRKALDALANSDVRYRRYSIEEIEAATEYFSESRKIGEGGYGPVYKCYLDHTSVAIKVLRPDAAQGRSQFQQEVCGQKQFSTGTSILENFQALILNRISKEKSVKSHFRKQFPQKHYFLKFIEQLKNEPLDFF